MGFAEDINKFAKKAVDNSNLVIRRTIIDIGQRVITRTPVGDANYWQSKPPAGYVGGHARFNWMYSMGSRVVQEVDGIDATPGGAGTLNRMIGSVPVNPADNVHYIQNSVPYIERLEDGYSRQAPLGMVAITAAEFQGIVEEQTGKVK